MENNSERKIPALASNGLAIDLLLLPVKRHLARLTLKELEALTFEECDETFIELVLNSIDSWTEDKDRDYYVQTNEFQIEVDYNLSIESAIYATRCEWNDDLEEAQIDNAAIPDFGKGKRDIQMRLFGMEARNDSGHISYKRLYKQYEKRGLVPDPIATLALSAQVPHLQEVKPYTCPWRDARNNNYNLHVDKDNGRQLWIGFDYGNQQNFRHNGRYLFPGRVE